MHKDRPWVATRTDVSGLYVGDYNIEYLSRAVVRHSIYANKILLIEPFQHPYILKPKFNPIENPNQYRAQTLKDVNFYFAMLPWIQAGLVEFIRTPADFDRRLNFEALTRARLLSQDAIIRAAIDESVKDMHERHADQQAKQLAILAAPDSYLRRIFKSLPKEENIVTEDEFITYVHSLRERDPNFLEPVGGSNSEQLHMLFAGGLMEMASSAAQMSGSYLFTDIKARWAQIERDRGSNAETQAWISKTIDCARESECRPAPHRGLAIASHRRWRRRLLPQALPTTWPLAQSKPLMH